jgi:hypothetical protein
MLASCGFVAHSIWLGRRHRDWWSSIDAARWQLARWSSEAEREARTILGDVQGLTRDQVHERLQARLGPDDPFPRPPPPTWPGALAGIAWAPPPEPPREHPVIWSVRTRNWQIFVSMCDGRADGLSVTTLNDTFYGTRVPSSRGMVSLLTVLSCDVVMIVAAGATILLWVVRRPYRWAIQVWLMAGALAAVATLAEDWKLGAGPNYRPFALRWTGWRSAPWEGPALGLVLGLLALRLRRQKPAPGICTGCGYDLTGNVSGVCPECGAPVTARSLSPASDAPAVTR